MSLSLIAMIYHGGLTQELRMGSRVWCTVEKYSALFLFLVLQFLN